MNTVVATGNSLGEIVPNTRCSRYRHAVRNVHRYLEPAVGQRGGMQPAVCGARTIAHARYPVPTGVGSGGVETGDGICDGVRDVFCEPL